MYSYFCRCTAVPNKLLEYVRKNLSNPDPRSSSYKGTRLT